MAEYIVKCFDDRDAKPYYAGCSEPGEITFWRVSECEAKRFASAAEALEEVGALDDGEWWTYMEDAWGAKIIEVSDP